MEKIVVFGSSNIDMVLNVEEMPQKGETIKCKEYKTVPGGKGANQAVACGRLGGDCVFLSKIGNDDAGEILTKSLNSAGVNTEKMAKLDNCPTGTAVIMVNANGNNSIVIIPGANGECDMNYVEENRNVIEEAGIVMTQLETAFSGVFGLIRMAKKAGKTVILNPAPASTKIPDDIFDGLDFITPNETELSTITGMPVNTIDEIEKASRAILEKGVKNVIVTIGSRGAFLCNEKECRLCPTYTGVKPVDTTAAGDTFNAGIAVGLAEGKSLDEAIRLANAAAAISVTRAGAQTSIPTRKEAETLISTRL
ncbi:MAG: ribokinase [Eubacteriales bacterium]|nr:ribokinase [Eubacteriales bacterium]